MKMVVLSQRNLMILILKNRMMRRKTQSRMKRLLTKGQENKSRLKANN
jgi:hypothetical protein